MSLSTMFEPLELPSGAVVRNRLMLAPLTNQLSPDAGTVSDDELNWIEKRAKGGFGLISSAAIAVEADGRAFPGQLGAYADRHVPGLRRLAQAVRRNGGVPMAQLQHGGKRSPTAITGTLALSACAADGARALAAHELPRVAQSFVAAALRAEQAGFEVIQLHAAYGFLLSDFLSPDTNLRTDGYGGTIDGRSRLLRETLVAVRAALRPTTMLSVRTNSGSAQRAADEIVPLASLLLKARFADHIDIVIDEPAALGPILGLDKGLGLLSVTGGFQDAQAIEQALASGADIVGIGTAAILHHDLPKRLLADRNWRPASLPVSIEHLQKEGVDGAFLTYLQGWPGFVEPVAQVA